MCLTQVSKLLEILILYDLCILLCAEKSQNCSDTPPNLVGGSCNTPNTTVVPCLCSSGFQSSGPVEPYLACNNGFWNLTYTCVAIQPTTQPIQSIPTTTTLQQYTIQSMQDPIEDLVIWSPTEYNPNPTGEFSAYTVAVSQGTNMTISVNFGDGGAYNFNFDASQTNYTSKCFDFTAILNQNISTSNKLILYRI